MGQNNSEPRTTNDDYFIKPWVTDHNVSTKIFGLTVSEISFKFDDENQLGEWIAYIRGNSERQRIDTTEKIVSAVNNTYGAGIRPESVKAMYEALLAIAAWPGNLPDDRLTTKTGPNDAAARGEMVATMRSFAKAAIEKAKL